MFDGGKRGQSGLGFFFGRYHQMGWKLLFSLPSPCPALITFALAISKIVINLGILLPDFIAFKTTHFALRNLRVSPLTRGVTLGIQIQIGGFVRSPSLPLLTRAVGLLRHGAHAVSFLGGWELLTNFTGFRTKHPSQVIRISGQTMKPFR